MDIKPDSLPPADFLNKMQTLLGEEYDAFAHTYTQPTHSSLRVNTLKLSAVDFIKKSPFTLSPVGAYEPAGFYLSDPEASPGSHPYHAAGLYYMQEPAAMTVAALMQPQPGEWVLDLAAAPGGKSTHLAALMQDEGLLVANDLNRSRVKHLAQNLERWGARQVLLTNNTPPQLAAAFGPLFDRVLVDAPCSGEGMFRRKGAFPWSEAMVAACSQRQSAILDTAVQLVRPGGWLVYATCTFSPEENEGVIGRFLAQHPTMHLVTPPHYAGFESGRPSWGEGRAPLQKTIRLWPHRFPGEGHFIALMQKTAADHPQVSPPPFSSSGANLSLWRAFSHDFLDIDWDERRLHLVHNRLYLLPHHALAPQALNVVRHGILLGELRRSHFKPAHHLALCLKRGEAQATVDYAATDPQLEAYLAGHDLPVSGANGWVLVTVDGVGLGWGKRVNGRLKNHYPRGLRR